MSLVFYDTETTGKATSFDQILQFAAIQTDPDLNEIDRFEIRSRLLPGIVPAPGAMQVNRTTVERLTDRSLPSHYEMVRAIRAKLQSWSPALFVGYNSIRFDEHLVRQAFYKTLHPPYLTNTNGNSRSDVMRMMFAVATLAPNAIALPIGDGGKTVFRLESVALANGFRHHRAHDAMGDVEATIFLARLVAERAPEIWSSFMRFSQKAAVADFISEEVIFSVSDVYGGVPYSYLVTSIGANPENTSEFYAFDLAVDHTELVSLSDAKLAARLAKSPKPIRTIKSNGSPILTTPDNAPATAATTRYSAQELEHRAGALRANKQLTARLIATLGSIKGDEDDRQPAHVEERIYDGFFPPSDQQLMDEFHRVAWENRMSVVSRFTDERLRELGRRLIHAERPDLLSEAECLEHDRFIAERIVTENEDLPWTTLPQALEEIERMIAEADADERKFLKRHQKYLSEWFDRASSG